MAAVDDWEDDRVAAELALFAPEETAATANLRDRLRKLLGRQGRRLLCRSSLPTCTGLLSRTAIDAKVGQLSDAEVQDAVDGLEKTLAPLQEADGVVVAGPKGILCKPNGPCLDPATEEGLTIAAYLMRNPSPADVYGCFR